MTEGYIVKRFGQPVKRYVQILELKDDPESLASYRKAHSREDFWPEIKQGIQEVGILEMELYIIGTREVMIVETPLDFDWDKAMARLAQLPRQQEWENFVGRFHVPTVCRRCHIRREVADDGAFLLSVRRLMTGNGRRNSCRLSGIMVGKSGDDDDNPYFFQPFS